MDGVISQKSIACSLLGRVDAVEREEVDVLGAQHDQRVVDALAQLLAVRSRPDLGLQLDVRAREPTPEHERRSQSQQPAHGREEGDSLLPDGGKGAADLALGAAVELGRLDVGDARLESQENRVHWGGPTESLCFLVYKPSEHRCFIPSSVIFII